MKNIFNFLFASMLILSMQSCTKDLVITNEPNAPEENESVQLRLTGNVAYMTPETRLNANGFVNNDLFGVYTTTGEMGSNKKADPENAKYIYKDGNIEAADESNAIYWEDNKSMKIYAYYPYDTTDNAGEKTAHLFSIKTNQSTAEDYYLSDFLRAESEDIAKTSSPVGMTFFHMMSKVSITINHDSSITDADFDTMTKELTIKGVANSGKINLISRSVAEPTGGANTITALANGNTFSAIIFPQNREDVKFRLKLGDKYYSSMLDIAYESGKEYRYIFTVTKNESALSLKSTRIENWGEGGTVEENMTAETK